MNNQVGKKCKKVTKGEMLFYLEEMMKMDMNDELEEDTYEMLMQDIDVDKGAIFTIYNRMQDWYEVAF